MKDMITAPADSFTMGSPLDEKGRDSIEDQVEVKLTEGSDSRRVAPKRVSKFACCFIRLARIGCYRASIGQHWYSQIKQ